MKKKYFTQANSALGFTCLQADNLIGIHTVYHLESASKQLVNDLLDALATDLEKEDFLIEYVYSAFDPSLVAGIVLRRLSLAFISGGPIVAGARLIDLSSAYQRSTLEKNKEELDVLQQEKDECYLAVYRHFGLALQIHNEWEQIYRNEMDINKANVYRRFVLDKLFSRIEIFNKESSIIRRFFGAQTGSGFVDFIAELTTGLKRYLIKGRPGTGKSTLMKAIANECQELGYDIEIYHCALDPESLDMVVVPELGFCVFDATDPHNYDPEWKTDEVLDTYEAFIEPNTDERFLEVIRDVTDRYLVEIKAGLTALNKAEELDKEIETMYTEVIVCEKRDALLVELKKLIKEKAD